MEAEQIFFLLRSAGHLDDGDGETVGGSSEHSRRQRHVILVQELCQKQPIMQNAVYIMHNYKL